MAFVRSLLFSLLVALSVAQQDPLKDFCRRFGHQTAVVDRKIYIDGGLINYSPFAVDSLNYTNVNLLYADFDVNNNGMPQEYNNLTKPASVPSVDGGILWEDTVNKMMYLYGGEYYQSSPDSFTNWAYDIINNNWTARSPDVTQGGIQRASFGAGVAVQDIGKGFYYGGWMSNQTVPSFGPNPVALSNLLSYDMVKNTWSNMTGPDSIGRAEGVMTYIPASDGGMLIYFGGIQTPYGNGTWTGVPMSEIHIYDIANAKFYTQTATGEIPEMRRRFCAGATWAQDQSSYNIYLYGGASMPPLTVGFDDVYILSIPSFTWIKWYPTAPGTPYPHHSLSCNVVDNAQMLVMGGTFPNSTSCDVASEYAFHNLDLGKDNPDGAKWALFQPNKTQYKVPSEIIAVVGGSATGGATVKAPQNGFSDRDLTTYFQRIYKAAARTPTRAIPGPTVLPTSSPTPSPQKSNIGAIAGGAAGGAVFLLAIVALLAWLCIKQRRRSAEAAVAQQNRPYQQQQQHHFQQASHNMYKRASPPPGELMAESLHELPSSPNMSKLGTNYQVHSLSSATPSTTYSPPYSPPHSPPQSPPPVPAVHSPSYSYQGQSPSSPYTVMPPYHPQTLAQQSTHSYPIQQPYPAMQTVYARPPQHHPSPPTQQYYPPPPQEEAPFIHAPDARRPSNPASIPNVRRREVGSVSSSGTSPGPAPGYKYDHEGR